VQKGVGLGVGTVIPCKEAVLANTSGEVAIGVVKFKLKSIVLMPRKRARQISPNSLAL
jgi:hypothetical protein